MTNTDPKPTTADRVARAVLAGLVALGLGFVAFVLLFLGVTTATGCFFECTDPNLIAGVPMLLGAVAAGSAAVTSVAWGVVGGRISRLWPIFAGSATLMVLWMVFVVFVG